MLVFQYIKASGQTIQESKKLAIVRLSNNGGSGFKFDICCTPQFFSSAHTFRTTPYKNIDTHKESGFLSKTKLVKADNQDEIKRKLKIGQTHQGGIIFKIEANGEHGLIAAKKILNTKVSVKNNNEVKSFARVVGFDAEKKNTMVLLAVRLGEDTINFASRFAAEYSVQADGNLPCSNSMNSECYNDWYLPSRYELNTMYKNLRQVGLSSFSSIQFLSSHDLINKDPWEQDEFDDANPFNYDNDTVFIRPIRAF